MALQNAEHGEPAGEGLAGTLTADGHIFKALVYYADTDFSGFVYHARYLEFLERGRSDYLRHAGIGHTALAAGSEGEALVWVVRRMDIEFIAPARIDDVVTVRTRVNEISGARIIMGQTMERNGAPLIAARVEAVIVTPAGRPRRFPKDWLSRLRPA
jgi:acyl-CoA thioester hydrolase